MVDLEPILKRLTEICERYERSAPTVQAWADDLYILINEKADTVVLSELNMVSRFLEDGQWMQPNLAANQVYKLLSRLGRDTTGMFDH